MFSHSAASRSTRGCAIVLAIAASLVICPNTQALTRDLEHVVITGADVSAYLGAAIGYIDASQKDVGTYLGDVFVYAYDPSAGELIQVPFQIDELSGGHYFVDGGTGNWSAYSDGALNAGDEIVIASRDVGPLAPPGAKVDDPEARANPAYMVEVTDPLSNEKGYLYLFRSSNLSQTASADYVDHRVIDVPASGWFEGDVQTSHYLVGYTKGNLSTMRNARGNNADIMDELLLWVDISFDLILSCAGSLYLDQGPDTGASIFQETHMDAAIDGTVRAIERTTSVTDIPLLGVYEETTRISNYYPSTIDLPVAFDTGTVTGLPSEICDVVARVIFDLHSNAVGLRYYSAHYPGNGYDDVDGNGPTQKVTTALSPYNFVTGPQGAVAHTTDIPSVFEPYVKSTYWDESGYNSNSGGAHSRDPGFQVPGLYGAFGLDVAVQLEEGGDPDDLLECLDDPLCAGGQSFSLIQRFFFLPPLAGQANDGPLYQSYTESPLTLTVSPFEPVPEFSTVGLIVAMALVGGALTWMARRSQAGGGT